MKVANTVESEDVFKSGCDFGNGPRTVIRSSCCTAIQKSALM